jgi:hypothetical protein
VCGRSRRHDRHRSITARHPEDIDAVDHRPLDERFEVLSGFQNPRLDAAIASALVESRLRCLPPA